MRPHPWGPDTRRVVLRSRLLVPFVLAAIVGACLSSSGPTAPSPVVSSLQPVTAPPSASVAPSTAASSEAPSVAPTEAPSPTATESPGASPSPSGSGSASAESCSGSDDNRAFFASAAQAFSWPVYCAVLPARWYGTGSYKSGKLEISYKGPDGGRFDLHEGAFCAVGADCTPAGSDAGTVTFGDRMTTLIHAYDGSLAAAVDRGQKISWMAVGQNLDDVTFGEILAALIRLD
jgi:hypothetical protein